MSQQWTNEMNDRRCDLIDREIDGTLTIEEKLELQKLQQQMLNFRRSVAPLPIRSVRELRRRLLEKSQRQK